MKQLFTIVLLLFSTLSYSQSNYLPFKKSRTKSGSENTTPTRKINEENQEFCEIYFDFPGAIVNNKTYAKHGTFQYLNVKGFTSNNEPGKPALPIRLTNIALPSGKDNVSIEIVEQEFIEYSNYRIHPALQPASDTHGAAEPEFEIDKELYSTNAFYPSNIVEINRYRKLRGIPIASVKISPVQFNPVTNKIRVYSKIKYRLVYGKKRTKGSRSIDLSKNTERYNNYIRSVVVNPNALPKPTSSRSKSTYSGDGKDYIIITHSEFLEIAQKLAKWKRQLGYTVEVVSRADWTAELVDLVLKERYNSWSHRPDYFVIIGDHDGDFPVPGKIMVDGSTSFASDNRYSCMDGIDDYEPDIAKGRLAARTKEDAEFMIDKIINYEKNPTRKASFYTTTLNCAYFQDSEKNGYATRRFCQTSEEVREHMLDQGYRVDRIYATNSPRPTNWNNGRYSGGERIPNSLDNFHWLAAGEGKDDIVREWNEGKFLIFHRDHGYTGGRGWADPHFMNDNIPELNNTTEYPVVFSINCHTGQFIETECFSELLMTNRTGGAVGVLSAAQSSYSGSNDALALGFYDAVWPGLVTKFSGSGGENIASPVHSPIYNMGDILNYGLNRMLETWQGGGTQDSYQCDLFHYFGDPTMEIRTKFPTTIEATFAETISCGATSLSIANCNIHNAYVTLCLNGQLYAKVQLAGGSGNLNFESLGTSSKDAVLTIYGHNSVPLIRNISIEGVCSFAPIADFQTPQYIVASGRTLQLKDISKRNPTAWKWTITPNSVTFVDETSATSANPKVKFNGSGTYTVELEVSNVNGKNTKTKTNYIVTKAGAPTNISSIVKSQNELNLSWEPNSEGDKVIIAYSTDGNVGTPEDGKLYTVGEHIAGGGKIAFIGSGSSFNHKNLPEFTSIQYKLWSYSSENNYSYIGSKHTNHTAKLLETPYLEPFTRGVKPDLVTGWTSVENSNTIWETLAYTNVSLCVGQKNRLGYTADDWLFSPGLVMNANQDYRISFKVKGVNENLIVNYGLAPEPIRANQGVIFDQKGINEEITVVKTVRPSQSGVYYLSFYHHGSASEIEIDNVSAVKLSSSSVSFWQGGTKDLETDWGTASNWIGNQVPTKNRDVYIGSNASYYPIVDEKADSKELYIQDGGKLTIEKGAHLSVNGNLWTGGGTSGEFEMNGGIVDVMQNYCGEDNSLTDINDGILNIKKSWIKNLKDGYHFCRGIAELSGGAINIDENAVFGGNSRWHGTMDGPVVITVGNNFRTFEDNWTMTDGTVILTGKMEGDNPTIFSSQDASVYYNLIIDGEGEWFNSSKDDIHVLNDLTIKAGNFDIDGAKVFQVDGDMIVKSGQTFIAKSSGNKTVDGDLYIECDAEVERLNSLLVRGKIHNDFCGEPISEFSSNVTTVVKGKTIQFEDMSINNPTSWLWTFEGGSITTSGDQNPSVRYNTVGTYNVELQVNNAIGNDNVYKTNYIVVTENEALVSAGFDANTVSVDQGNSIEFTDVSLNNPTSWVWTFEGGTPASSTIKHPTVTYSTTGVFDVTLSVGDGSGSDEVVKSNYVVVNNVSMPTKAGFSVNESSISEGEQIQFSDESTHSPINWKWEFEGGVPETSTEQHPVVSYNEKGNYSVKLTTYNASGFNTLVKDNYIKVLAGLSSPKTMFSSNFVNVDQNGVISFTDESTNNPTSWNWTFEGGSPATSTVQNPVVTYNSKGNYKVILKTVNDYGNSLKTIDNYVTVENAINYCEASHAENDRYINLVQLGNINNESGAETGGYHDYTAQSADLIVGETYPMLVEQTHRLEIMTLGVWIDWNMDGDFDDANEVIYKLAAGIQFSPYNFTVTVPQGTRKGKTRMRVRSHYNKVPFACGYDSKATGEAEDYTINIVGKASVDANFGTSSTHIERTESVNFFDLSTNNPTAWNWTFEGGTPATSSEQNPTVSYNSAGAFNVSLKIQNANGSSQRVEMNYILVGNTDILSNFTAIQTSIIQGKSVSFTDSSTGSPTSWNWTFEGGTPAMSTEQNPVVTYNTPGSYTVTLECSNASDNSIKTVENCVIVSPTTGYCEASYPNNDRYINLVQLEDIYNESGAETGGYHDYTAQSTDLAIGETYEMLVEQTYRNKILAVGVWIDWNADGDFDDTDELVYNLEPGVQYSPYNFAVSVPQGAVKGETRMRVRSHYNKTPFACGHDAKATGEAEDYTVNIVNKSETDNRDFISNTTEITTDITANDITIAPNPFKNQFSIKFNSNKKTNADIEIHNMNGQIVYKDNVELIIGTNELLVRPCLNAGMYIVSVSSKDFHISKKVLKLK